MIFCGNREYDDMSDPQTQIKLWLKSGLAEMGHGAKSRLAEALSVRPDAITRMTNLDGKEPREIKAHELTIIEDFLGKPAPVGRRPIVASYDPDEPEDRSEAGAGFAREHWRASILGAVPELDGKLGAGEGQVGEVITLPTGGIMSGHRVVAEWVFPPEYLRSEAKAAPANTIVMEIVGDSMVPTYQPGDRVLIDLSQRTLGSDTVYAISDGQSEPQIKRLQRVPFSDPPQVIIISDNPNLQSFTVDLSRLTIIGRICAVVARR